MTQRSGRSFGRRARQWLGCTLKFSKWPRLWVQAQNNQNRSFFLMNLLLGRGLFGQYFWPTLPNVGLSRSGCYSRVLVSVSGDGQRSLLSWFHTRHASNAKVKRNSWVPNDIASIMTERQHLRPCQPFLRYDMKSIEQTKLLIHRTLIHTAQWRQPDNLLITKKYHIILYIWNDADYIT